MEATKFSIVEKIVNFLKLGEEGKLGSFFERVVKNLNKNIALHEKNIENLKFNSKNALDALADQLADAKEELTNVYLNVQPDDVATNAKQEDFLDEYLNRIEAAELAVSRIEEKITAEKDRTADSVKEAQVQITELKARIENITNMK